MSFGCLTSRPGPRSLLASLLLCLFSVTARGDLWRTGYYTAWEQADMPAASVDFSALTHIIHFSLVPNPDGTLDDEHNSLSPANSADLVTRARAAGVKALVCLGGSGSEHGFQGATSVSNLPAFINNLTNFVAARNYDGVDIDWEPLPSSDFVKYTNLLKSLRTALNQMAQPKLLTVAAEAYPPYGDSATAGYRMFAAFQSQIDQINVMTYDMSGPYSGWSTWFNSPLYDGGYHLPSSGTLVPSVNGAVDNFITNGVAPAKLAIAVAFYGYVWTGGTGSSASSITQPRQSWINAPTAKACRYTEIMTGYYASKFYRWDTNAQSAYLSITNANPTNNTFVSYDDERTCQAKVNYARKKGLGGIAIWELGQDHTRNSPDPLLEAIKQSFAVPAPAGLQHSGGSPNFPVKAIAGISPIINSGETTNQFEP